MHVRGIMSTVGSVQYHGEKSFVIRVMISPTCIMISPTLLKLQRMVSPSGTDYPHGSHGIPHVHHDILHGTEYPHGTQDIPHIYQDIPHGTEYPPPYSRYPSTSVMVSPTVLHTRYTGCKSPLRKRSQLGSIFAVFQQSAKNPT